MSKHKHGNGANNETEQSGTDHAAAQGADHTTGSEGDHAAGESRDDLIAKAATVGAVAVGVALVEVAWLPGLVLGVAAVLAPKYLPALGNGLRPLMKSTVRGAYKVGRKARETMAEAQEHLHDLAAEVRSEEVEGLGAGGVGVASAEVSPAHS